MRNIDLHAKRLNCIKKIQENNEKIARLAKDNERLTASLKSMSPDIDPERAERYRRELASDNWKKYSEMYKNQ